MLAEAAAQLTLGAVAHQALDAQDHDIEQRPAGLRADYPSVLVRLPYLAGGLDDLPAGLSLMAASCLALFGMTYGGEVCI